MKKVPTKADLRRQLEREMERYLMRGGRVTEVPQGQSGKEPDDPPVFLNRRLFVEPRTKRTLVPEVIAAIESRRKTKPQRTPAPKRSRLPKPRRKTIYDDFGEPLRRVWSDE